ncbi:hypothetical protein HY798_00800 [Candidatus Falkowbacteria bacterium]|nr:hypothetical protein [Candidatus Falkowbacteria bacterium]
MAIFPQISLEQLNLSPQKFNFEGGGKKQKLLLVALIILLVATALILYFGFFSASSVLQPIGQEELVATSGTGPSVAPDLSTSQAFNLEGVSLDFSVFDSDVFNGLQELGSPLDLSGEKGRNNPFIPY